MGILYFLDALIMQLLEPYAVAAVVICWLLKPVLMEIVKKWDGRATYSFESKFNGITSQEETLKPQDSIPPSHLEGLESLHAEINAIRKYVIEMKIHLKIAVFESYSFRLIPSLEIYNKNWDRQKYFQRTSMGIEKELVKIREFAREESLRINLIFLADGGYMFDYFNEKKG